MTPPLPPGTALAQRELAASDPILAEVMKRVGPCVIVPAGRVNLFQALLRAIIYQQLHGAAAKAIHGRVLATIGGERTTAASLARIEDAALRSAGLSANKLKAVRDLAAKSLDGTVPPPRVVARLSDEELIARLTTIRGIGPWTVHMLMIFHLGRPDVMPTGDFAIRQAFSRLYRRGRPETVGGILKHAKRWQPYRSLASWYLWRSLDTVVPEEGKGKEVRRS